MCLAGATQLRSSPGYTVRRARCAAPRARGRFPSSVGGISSSSTSAAHRSAAMAGGARPDPFRTRKLSRRAPMVLRGQPVGEQGAADRWTALDPYQRGRARGRAGDPPRRSPFHIPLRPRGPSGALFSCRGHPGFLVLFMFSGHAVAVPFPSLFTWLDRTFHTVFRCTSSAFCFGVRFESDFLHIFLVQLLFNQERPFPWLLFTF